MQRATGSRTVLLSAALLVLAGPSLWARDWYVSTTGKAGSPATFELPTELFSALDRAQANDTIIMRGGSYRGPQITKRMIFLQKEGLTLRAQEGERPVISIPVEDRQSSILWFYAPNCTIEGLELVGGGEHCVKMERPGGVVRNCVLRGSGDQRRGYRQRRRQRARRPGLLRPRHHEQWHLHEGRGQGLHYRGQSGHRL